MTHTTQNTTQRQVPDDRLLERVAGAENARATDVDLQSEDGARVWRRARTLLVVSLTRLYWSGAFIFLATTLYAITNRSQWLNDGVQASTVGGLLLTFVVGYSWFRKRAGKAYNKPRPREIVYILLTLISSVTLVALIHHPLIYAYPIVASATIARMRLRYALTFLSMVVIAQLAATAFLWPPSEWKYWTFIVAVQVQYLSFSLARNLFREWRSVERLARMNRDLSSTRGLLRETAAMAEKIRLADELHDVTGHKLVAATLHLDVLADADLSDDDLSRVNSLTSLVQELIDDLRALVAAREPLPATSFVPSMEALVRAMPDGVCELRIEDEFKPTMPQAESLLRVIQEAVTNSLKHADARKIIIECRTNTDPNGNNLKVVVSDDGRGFALDKHQGRGVGLSTMSRRMERLGGRLYIHSDVGSGTVVTAELAEDA